MFMLNMINLFSRNIYNIICMYKGVTYIVKKRKDFDENYAKILDSCASILYTCIFMIYIISAGR